MKRIVALIKKLEPFVHIFVTSRPHVEMRSNARAFIPLIRVDEANTSDIESYLRAVIDEDEELEDVISCVPTAREDIIKTIIERVDGM